jgi:preprotein translocase subunit Sec61beta
MPTLNKSPSVARESHRLNLPHGLIRFYEQNRHLPLYLIAVTAIIFVILLSFIIFMARKGGTA